MKIFKLHLFSLMLAFAAGLNGQVLEVTPTFPTIEDNVTIIYDATQGNAALVGVTPIYAHMGLITSTSSSSTDWQFVQGSWGTADPDVLMTDIGDNRHSIAVDIDQFYGFPGGTEVLQLAFVFRNQAGTIVGRAEGGGDIFYDIFPVDAGLQVDFLSPASSLIADEGDFINVEIGTNTSADITLFDNGVEVASATNSTTLSHSITVALPAQHELVVVAEDGTGQASDTLFYTVNGPVEVVNPPGFMLDGLNYIDDNTVILQLHAPAKDFIYVIGDFNNWMASPDYYMHLADDLETWWVQIDNLEAGEAYAFQYWIDGELRLADPCSKLILDPNNDSSLPALVYPDPHPYPIGKTTGFCSMMFPGQEEYQWQSNDYVRPANKDLRIYELHMRDFLATKSYTTLVDTLDYLEELGINAIEFMPPGEFENNDSWGYNPSFHMALDKRYGTPEMFKAVVDECHSRGIAVIIDIVFNHAFGQSPLVNMYADPDGGASSENPWFNQVCPHEPYCWGEDFNHEAAATKRFMDRVNRHWIEEYRADGFRFDFTKGFTNTPNANDVYNAPRVANLQRMSDAIWSVDPEAYIILEHFAVNSEEEVLSDYGMMIWGNLTFSYAEAAMGWLSGSNFDWGIYSQRGWSDPNLVTYMESHDEERLSFKVQEFGNFNPNYNTRDYATAMARHELAAVFFLSQPGPKMIWQFGELGYDVSIDVPCRVCPKPILWNYFQLNNRRRLYDVYSTMNALREDYPNTFNSTDINYSLGGQFKRINLYNPGLDAVVIGNFGITEVSGVPNFPFTGTWYDYFSGEAIIEENLSNPFLLQPGEYRIYTSQPLETPVLTTSVEEMELLDISLNLYPNPAMDQITADFELEGEGMMEVMILDMNGRIIREVSKGNVQAGMQRVLVDVQDLAEGNYHLLIALNGDANAFPFVKE